MPLKLATAGRGLIGVVQGVLRGHVIDDNVVRRLIQLVPGYASSRAQPVLREAIGAQRRHFHV